MPFLWNTTMKLLSKPESPSPKYRMNSPFGSFIEKASLPAFWKKKIWAGMTVEASMVLPLFLFFFINLGSAMEMMRLHGKLQLALWDVGNRMCIYGHVLNPTGNGSGSASADKAETVSAKKTDSGQNWWQELGDIALTYTYVKNQIVNYAGEEYLEESPLSHGVAGLQFWESDILQSGGTTSSANVLDVVMTYQVAPWIEIPFVRPFRMSNRYYGRLWTGYDLGDGRGDRDDTSQDVVYITEYGTVYHESLSCTHLKLSISEVSMKEAKEARNESGGRYTECSKCKKKLFQGTVFIARDGDCYHYDRECSGLKRIIYTIPRQQASKYRPCSRCAR